MSPPSELKLTVQPVGSRTTTTPSDRRVQAYELFDIELDAIANAANFSTWLISLSLMCISSAIAIVAGPSSGYKWAVFVALVIIGLVIGWFGHGQFKAKNSLVEKIRSQSEPRSPV